MWSAVALHDCCGIHGRSTVRRQMTRDGGVAMSRDYTEITDEQLRAINKRAVEQPSYEQLREQNRVLRSNLVNCAARLEAYYGEDYPAVRDAKAALTATSQSQPPYKEWCRHPDKCAGLASCPQDPTCAD